jgi:hypothetical protein
LGSCSYKPTKILKKENLQVTTQIENKQGSYTHKPTKKIKIRKLQHILEKNKAPN